MKTETKLLIGLTAILLLTGCGASKIPTALTQTSSSTDDSTDTDSEDTTGAVEVGALARCVAFNHSVTGGQELNGYITSYANSYGSTDTDKLRFIFIKVPAGITDGTQFINAFGLYLDQSSRLQSTPAMGFAFINRADGRHYNLSNPIKALTKASIQNTFINGNSLQNSLNLSNFFRKTIVLLVGVSSEVQAIRLSVYNSSNSQLVNRLDSIAPSKYLSANPYRYARNTASSFLTNLHPYLEDMLDISLSQALNEDANFYNKSEGVCRDSITQHIQ